MNEKRKIKKAKLSITQYNTCKWCDQTFFFTVYPSSKKNGHKGIFCSQECQIRYLKSKSFNFPCCICGKVVFTQPAQMKYRNRKTCGRNCNGKLRRIVAAKRRIDLGYTKHQLDRLARYSPEAKKWRMAIFERDDFTCQICKIRGTYLEADHIKPFAYFPELRYDLTNGRTLCRPCHNTTKISAKEMKRIYG